jgi:hypothetical protein
MRDQFVATFSLIERGPNQASEVRDASFARLPMEASPRQNAPRTFFFPSGALFAQLGERIDRRGSCEGPA